MVKKQWFVIEIKASKTVLMLKLMLKQIQMGFDFST